MASVSVNRTDPLRNFKFRVSIIPNFTSVGSDGKTTTTTGPFGNKSSLNLGFAVVSGLSVQNQMIPYREGGMNTHPHKMVGQSDYPPVTFSRGVFSAQEDLWAWQQLIHQWNQGSSVGSQSGSDYRCTIVVGVYDHPATAKAVYSDDASNPDSPLTGSTTLKFKYTLQNCWPGGYALGDLNASESSIMVQQLTVHHEGFYLNFAPDAGKGLDADNY